MGATWKVGIIGELGGRRVLVVWMLHFGRATHPGPVTGLDPLDHLSFRGVCQTLVAG